MEERSNDYPPHPFDAGPGVPGVQVGPADDSRHHDVDDLDDVELTPAEADEIRRRRVTPRRRTARTSSRARSSSPARRSKSRKGSEVTLGAVAVAGGAGYGAYWLVAAVLSLEPSLALLAGGYVAGICSGGVVWPLWRSARRAVGAWITPRGAR